MARHIELGVRGRHFLIGILACNKIPGTNLSRLHRHETHDFRGDSRRKLIVTIFQDEHK